MYKNIPFEPALDFTRTLLIVTFALSGLAPFGFNHAATLTSIEEYELQEQCGKRAAEVFIKKYGNSGVIYTKDGQVIAQYTNHYNRKLKKCFVLQIYRNIPYKDITQDSSVSYLLYDVNENKRYGDYFQSEGMDFPTSCTIEDKTTCHSEREWNNLVRPYMEE